MYGTISLTNSLLTFSTPERCIVMISWITCSIIELKKKTLQPGSISLELKSVRTQTPYWSFNCYVHGIRLIYFRKMFLPIKLGLKHLEFCYFYAIFVTAHSSIYRFIFLSTKYYEFSLSVFLKSSWVFLSFDFLFSFFWVCFVVHRIKNNNLRNATEPKIVIFLRMT